MKAVHWLPILALGFFLGMRHATDADHVVAVATIVAREKRARVASLVGALWGVGHTLTILIVGGAIIGFGLVLPPRIGLSMELAVALMLVLLGGWNMAAFFQSITRERSENESQHRHTTWLGIVGKNQALRSVVIGIVHGLAGSAAAALLVLTTIHDVRWALIYLAFFGVGTIAGMMVITSVMAVPMAYAANRARRITRHLAWISGVLSVAFGIFLVYEVGIVDGLFTSHPVWEPR